MPLAAPPAPAERHPYRRLGLAASPTAMARAVGIEALDDWQLDVLASRQPQIALVASRQAGKSSVAALAALRECLYHAPALVLLLSPSLRQSQELFGKLRQYHQQLGDDAEAIVEESALRIRWRNGSRVVALPGKEQTIRGYSAVKLLVVDEAGAVDDGLYQAVRPMLAVSRGRVMLLGTPRGRRGFFFEEWQAGLTDGGWHQVQIPAAKVKRIDPAWLAVEKLRIPDTWYQQEYCCAWTESEGSLFAFDDIERAFGHDTIEALYPARPRPFSDGEFAHVPRIATL